MGGIKRSSGDVIFDIIIVIILFAFAISILYPIYFSFLYSIEGVSGTAKGLVKWLVPRQFSTFAYKYIFQEEDIYWAFLVTLTRTLIGTVCSVFFTAMFGYALSRKKLYFKKFYRTVGVITMYFGGGLIPFYLTLSYLHLLDTFQMYIIINLLSMFNTILFITFFSEIPDALEESAYIDGANDFYIFIRIAIPLSTPVIATVALFNGVAHWNSWFDAAYFVNNKRLQTLQSILWRLISESRAIETLNRYTTGEKRTQSQIDAMKFATMLVSIIPITLAYPFLQRCFVKGMMIGSIKS